MVKRDNNYDLDWHMIDLFEIEVQWIKRLFNGIRQHFEDNLITERFLVKH